MKIRGFRVEPGEIEATLMQHPDVLEAVVVARGDSAGGIRRLVAYVRCPADTARRLRDFLRAKLPYYMVPSAIVRVDSFARTTNGKIDRPDVDGAYEPPRGDTECRIAEIWGDVLNVRLVGRNDNFFEIGGNSVTALQVVTRMRSAGVLNISVRRLFEWPTIAELSKLKR